MKKTVYFELILNFLGSNPNGTAPERFETAEEAKSYFIKHYRNRNKLDGNDNYWNTLPLVINKVTVINEMIEDERTPEQIAQNFVHLIDGKYKYLKNSIWSNAFNTKKEAIETFIKLELTN